MIAARPGFGLRAAGVSVDGRALLSGVTLDLRPGAVHGLVGHNGSGKSTLLRLLARQQAPTEGAVELGGRGVAAWPARAFARQVAYLPQSTPDATGLTVRELVRFGRYPWHGPFGRVTGDDLARVEEAIGLCGLAGMADRAVDTLSGGERQRAWIAMLVCQEAGFLLLDEPISALDLAQQIEVLGLLRSLVGARGCGAVAVLHDINMAARFCDEIVALKGGCVIARGGPDELMRDHALEAIFGVPMHVVPRPGGGRPIGVPR